MQDALHYALQENRDVPRSDRYGLPNLTVKFTLELTLEEQARLETALEKAGAEIAPAIGEERLETRDVVLYMVERFLRTDPEGTPEGRRERDDSPYMIIYNACPECRRARLMSSDGPIEVAPESVDRLTGDAEEETMDRRNSSTLARRVKLRAHHIEYRDVCQNPGCGHRGKLHAHHIEYRSHGGPTIPENESSVCTRCHSLLHAGLLEVSGNPVEGLSWQPRSRTLLVDSDGDAYAMAEIPVVRAESASADSADVKDSHVKDSHVKDSITALVHLGFSRKEAGARVEKAYRVLVQSGQDPDEKRLLTQALVSS